MTSLAAVMKELKSLGSEQTRKTFARHGADPSRMFGVKVGDLKGIEKKIRREQALALELEQQPMNFQAARLSRSELAQHLDGAIDILALPRQQLQPRLMKQELRIVRLARSTALELRVG